MVALFRAYTIEIYVFSVKNVTSCGKNSYVTLLFKNCGNNVRFYCLQPKIAVLRFGKNIPWGASVNSRQQKSIGYGIFATTCVIK